MERYEFKDGASHKFWEVTVEDETLIVRFGKIGTTGQTREKGFDNAAAAEREKAKLVKEKTQKGYVAAGASATPAPAVGKETPLKAESAPEDIQTAVAPPPPPVPIKRPAWVSGDRILKVAPLPTRMRPDKARPADESWAAFAQILSAKAESGVVWPQNLVRAGPQSVLTAAQTAQQFIDIQNVLNEARVDQSSKRTANLPWFRSATTTPTGLCRRVAHPSPWRWRMRSFDAKGRGATRIAPQRGVCHPSSPCGLR